MGIQIFEWSWTNALESFARSLNVAEAMAGTFVSLSPGINIERPRKVLQFLRMTWELQKSKNPTTILKSRRS